MADQTHNSWAAEDKDLQPPSCPTVTNVSATGGEPQGGSRTKSQALINLCAEPPILNLRAQQAPGNASSQSYLPPGASHPQNIHGEQSELALWAACKSPESGWKNDDPPQTFYAPFPPPYRNLPITSPMQQIYRHPQRRYLPCLQLLQKPLLEHRPSPPTSLQDESYLHSPGPRDLVPLGERNPPQTTRSLPALPSPTSQVEPQISETSVPAGPSRPSNAKASPADLKEVKTHKGKQRKHQTKGLNEVLAQPRSEHCLSSLHWIVRTPEIPLAPASSLDSEFENMPHILPGLQEAQAPGGDSSEARPKTDVPQTSQGPLAQEESRQAQGNNSGLTGNAVGAGLPKRDRDQSQDLPCLATGTPGIASSSGPHVDSSGGKISPMPTSPGKELVPVIDLCSSDEDLKEVTGAQNSDSSTELHATKERKKKFSQKKIDCKLFIQGTKVKMSGRVLAPARNHQERKQDAATIKSLGNKKKSDNGQSKDQGEGKLKKARGSTSKRKGVSPGSLLDTQKAPGSTSKRKGVSPGSPPLGKSSRISVMTGHNSQATHPLPSQSAIDPELSKVKGKRKTSLTEMEPSPKKPQITLEIDTATPPHQLGKNLLRSEKSQMSLKKEENKTRGGVSSETRGNWQFLQKREEPWKKIHAKVAAEASRIKSIPCLLEPLQDLTQAKMPREVLTRNEDPKVFLPELLLQEPSKLDEDQAGSTSKDLMMDHVALGLERIQSKTQCKEKARINVSLSGMKGKKRYPKTEAEDVPKPVPRTNLALQMMESVQVLYPLGKSNVSSGPIKKVHSVPSYNLVPEDLLITKAKILPKPLTKAPLQPPTKPHLQLVPKPPAHAWPKPMSYHLSKLSSYPVPKPQAQQASKPPLRAPRQKLPLVSVPTQELTLDLPVWKQVPLAPIPPATKPSNSQLLYKSRKIQALRKATSLTETVIWPGQMSTAFKASPLLEDPSSSPRYEGATFIPWRTPPQDLEASEPISATQRPLREQMKRDAQKEREEAACWTSVGRIKAFLEQETEMDTSLQFGYPRFGCPWR